MQTTYSYNADELNEVFLDSVKSSFKGKRVEIVVFEEDETSYLNSSEKMISRINEARTRTVGVPLENVIEKHSL